MLTLEVTYLDVSEVWSKSMGLLYRTQNNTDRAKEELSSNLICLYYNDVYLCISSDLICLYYNDFYLCIWSFKWTLKLARSKMDCTNWHGQRTIPLFSWLRVRAYSSNLFSGNSFISSPLESKARSDNPFEAITKGADTVIFIY